MCPFLVTCADLKDRSNDLSFVFHQIYQKPLYNCGIGCNQFTAQQWAHIICAVVKAKMLVLNCARCCCSALFSTVAVVSFVVYQFGIQLSDANSKILGTFCARNERDRTKFVDDLKEAISEVQHFGM